jgi:hypothetical protein
MTAFVRPGYYQSDQSGAYKDFLTLWKDADPDIPVLIAARKEYAGLH